MAIPANPRPGATPQNLGDGETRAFTIAANGTSFRTLIDGLYSNKIRAVIRELCSNAWDSHIDAKNPKPFSVQIPTRLDPVFKVRDYGTSLSHNDMMVLYTTIFQSTKTGTNDATGQLGLGSKSPFAYTDTFQITAYMEGTKRLYLTFLATDGVPNIKFMGGGPSDEPNGLEVSFAAKREDIYEFQREMQFVSMGYKVQPDVTGMEIKITAPRLQGTNWMIYPRSAFGENVRTNHWVRMGSALYPTERPFPNVQSGWVTVTDIPIGSAQVTGSRETLSYDPQTRAAIDKVQEAAHRELKAQIDVLIAAATTRIEKAKVYKEYNGILANMRGSAMVNLWDDPNQTYGRTGNRPGDVVEMASHFGKGQNARGVSHRWRSQFEVDEISRLLFIVNDQETKMVRRQARIRNASLVHPGTFPMVINLPEKLVTLTPAVPSANMLTPAVKASQKTTYPRKEAIAWIKECLAPLRDDQFIMASSIPDIPPAKRPNAGVKKPPRLLAPNQYWMSRQEGRIVSDIYGISDRGAREWPTNMRKAMNAANVLPNWDDVFWCTERQEEAYKKKNQLPAKMKLDVVIQAALKRKVASAPLDEAQTLNTILQMVGSYNKALPVVLENFFPNIKMTEETSRKVLALAELAEIDLRIRPIVGTINIRIRELIAQYPLLFQKSDRSHYEHYVAAVKAAEKEEAKS